MYGSVDRYSLKGIKYDITDGILYIGSSDDYIILVITTCFGCIYNPSEKKYAYILEDAHGKKTRLTYDMIKGITIRYLPSNYKYENLLESGGVGIIVKIMEHNITHIDQYQNSIIYVSSSALGALKTITFNSKYVSDNFTDGTLNLKTSSIFRYLIRQPVIKGMNIILYTPIESLQTQDNNIIFSPPIYIEYFRFPDCNLIDIVNSKVYNGQFEYKGQMREIRYIDEYGIIKSTKDGYIDDDGKVMAIPHRIDRNIINKKQK